MPLTFSSNIVVIMVLLSVTWKLNIKLKEHFSDKHGNAKVIDI